MVYSFVYSTFLYPIAYIFPAYAANGAPVLFHGGGPLDFKKKIGGKRILGDNKTVIGLLSGILAGSIAGALEGFVLPQMLLIGVLLAVGAIVGDLVGSFIKRRIDMKSGQSLPIMDQFGFLIFALLFALGLGSLPTLYGIIFIVVLTGLLHPLTNIGAHRLKLKSVPW